MPDRILPGWPTKFLSLSWLAFATANSHCICHCKQIKLYKQSRAAHLEIVFLEWSFRKTIPCRNGVVIQELSSRNVNCYPNSQLGCSSALDHIHGVVNSFSVRDHKLSMVDCGVNCSSGPQAVVVHTKQSSIDEWISIDSTTNIELSNK